MKLNFSFYEWLLILNPECRIRITCSDGRVYEGKKASPIEFEMEWIGVVLTPHKQVVL